MLWISAGIFLNQIVSFIYTSPENSNDLCAGKGNIPLIGKMAKLREDKGHFLTS
jgi:hypothetical protein